MLRSNQRHNGNNRNQNGNVNHNNNGFQQGGNGKGHQSQPARITTPIPILRATQTPDAIKAINAVNAIKDDYGSSNNPNQHQNQDYDYYNNDVTEEYIDIRQENNYETGKYYYRVTEGL